MNEYDDTTYGNWISEVYDEFYVEFDPVSIELLASIAGDGPALELGIGTGRIALPLHRKGIDVQGIDASDAMLSKLREKDGGDKIKTLTGSFADFKIEQSFSLIYVVFNTFFALLTQEEQAHCFQTVSDHLSEGGVFLIEAFVPDLRRFEDDQTVRAVGISEKLVKLEVTQHDPASQHITSQRVLLSNEGNRLYPVKLRYAWPSELDLMAKIAGLSLQHRWSSWRKDKFTGKSKQHISVYGH